MRLNITFYEKDSGEYIGIIYGAEVLPRTGEFIEFEDDDIKARFQVHSIEHYLHCKTGNLHDDVCYYHIQVMVLEKTKKVPKPNKPLPEPKIKKRKRILGWRRGGHKKETVEEVK